MDKTEKAEWELIIEDLKKKSLASWEEFRKNHIVNTDNFLIIILKFHLFSEALIDEILSGCLPNFEKIQRFSYSEKVDLLEAVGVILNDKVIKDLRALNNLRNKYAHNLNFKFKETDLKMFSYFDSSNGKEDSELTLSKQLSYLMGFLTSKKLMNESIPFVMAYLRNKTMYEKDLIWKKEKVKNLFSRERIKFFLDRMMLKP